MSAKNTRETILSRVEELKKQIEMVSNQIEKDREENDEDSAVLHELLDKKDFLEQSINDLLSSLKNNELPESIGLQFKIDLNGSTRAFKIVHPSEADSQVGHISSDSPLAKALDGSGEGDNVVFESPAGKQTIKVLEVIAQN